MADVEWSYGEKRITPKVIHIYRTGVGYLCDKVIPNTSWPNTKMDSDFASILPICSDCLEARG